MESKPTLTLSSPLFLEGTAHFQREQIFSVYLLHVGLEEWCFHSGTGMTEHHFHRVYSSMSTYLHMLR